MRHTALGGQDSRQDRPEPRDLHPELRSFPLGSRWRHKRSGRLAEVVASGWDSSAEAVWFCLRYLEGRSSSRRMTTRSLLRCYTHEEPDARQCSRRRRRSGTR